MGSVPQQQWNPPCSLGDNRNSMANYWVITIGINQYRHLQPLAHAQNDALYIHRFFTEEGGVPLDQCVLISDLSTSVGQQIVYPDKPMIAEWVQTITHQVQADDVLWFFFSGYGAQVEGENGQKVDYLMPIDGDPGKIESTGIALFELMDTLAGLPTDKTLLVLDINRSQGTLSGQSIGAQAIELAQSRQVPTLLSCQPEQYSHGSIFGIRPGLFTATLLEAMRQDCRTVEQLGDYLAQRLPELCKHHLRPVQNPVTVVTGDRKLLQVVPEANSALTTVASEMVASEMTATSPVTSQATELTAVASSVSEALSAKTGAIPHTEEAVSTGTYRSPEALSSRREANHKADQALSDKEWSDKRLAGKRTKDAENAENAENAAAADSMAISGAKLRNWGLLTLAILMGGVLLKQPFVGAAWNRITNGQKTAVETSEGAVDTEDLRAENAAVQTPLTGTSSAEPETTGQALTESAKSSEASGSDTGTADQATAKADSKTDSKTDGAETADSAVNPAASADSKKAASAGNKAESDKVSAQKLMAQANTALAQRQYTEALIALQQVPQSQRDEKFSAVLTQARAGAAEAEKTNASVLTEARTVIQPTQASQFAEAIAQARKIQPGEPLYEAAQKDILGWSQVILDIAKGRATSGNLEGAIAAAKVMPYDNAEYHQKAQSNIEFWQERQQSRNVIVEAQKIPKLGQANTYQKGIVKLREVPIEHPEYENAQRLADQWSESIFSIAQARAAQGRDSEAIQAAVLVPAGTVAYEPTQQAIRRWRASE